MSNGIFAWLLATFCLTTGSPVEAQQSKVYHVGVILHGGPYYDTISGLRNGLNELRTKEGNYDALRLTLYPLPSLLVFPHGVDEAALVQFLNET